MPERRIIRFEHLNGVGKVVYATGAVATAATRLIESLLDRAADVIVEAERAFEQARDEDVEDARFRDV